MCEFGAYALLKGPHEVFPVGPLEEGFAVAGIVDLIVSRDHRVHLVSTLVHGLGESGSELPGPRGIHDPGLVQRLTSDAVGRLSDRR